MRDLRDPDINRFRLPDDDAAFKAMGHEGPVDPQFNGRFIVPYVVGPKPVELRVIAASGGGWDHVSVSTIDRCPTWHEMQFIHRKFFKLTETAMELHVPAEDHINNHPYTLHLWRPHSKLRRIPLHRKDMCK